jgi:drug/metabolite transporter (DMT)-like permease
MWGKGQTLGDLIVNMAGTPAGEVLALALALLSAVSHAIFGAIHKSGARPVFEPRRDQHRLRRAWRCPLRCSCFRCPRRSLWRMLAVVFLVHITYEWYQAACYARGEFTLVYPIARGTGPLVVCVLGWIVFGETLQLSQWFGALLLSSAIMALALFNLRDRGLVGALDGSIDPERAAAIRLAIVTALITGVLIASYTVIDAYAIRLADNPFTFLAWFFTLSGFGFPWIALARYRRMAPAARPPVGDLAVTGVFGAIIALTSFGALLLAVRLDKVGEAAALRETSIVFATAIGVLIFRETVSAQKLGIIGLIALGAILVEFG